ncbi:MAG: hypothetical protein KBT22_01245, partial [Bacteroidales bacterium]|nr:hypothetical protein [Candidatus Scybalocola fimicaballi]
ISYGIDGDNITYITDECGEKLDVLYKKGSESEKNLKDESVKVELDGKDDTESIVWNLVDPSNMKSDDCTTNVSATDNIAPNLTEAALDPATVKYSDNETDKCHADYKWSKEEITEWLKKIKDCSGVKTVTYVVKDKDGNVLTDSWGTGTIVDEGTVSDMILPGLKRGEYEIEYTIVDNSGNDNTTTMSQNMTVVDDIAPEIDCNNDNVIEVPVGTGCTADIDLDVNNILYASRAEKILGTTAVDKSGETIKYESSNDINKSIFKTTYAFTDAQKTAMSNDCGEPLTTKVVVSTMNSNGDFVAEGDPIEDNQTETISIKYKEEKQITVVVSDAAGNPVECTYTLVGAPQIVTPNDLADELGFSTKKDASGKEECSVEYSKTFADIYKEIYGVEYEDCSPVKELKYEIEDKNSGDKINGSIKPNGTTSFDENLVPGDYTITWNSVDLVGNDTKVDDHDIKVKDGVAPEIACADVTIPMDDKCEASIDMNLHQFALGYLKDHITVDEETGEISAKTEADKALFKLSPDKKTITNIYDGCKTDLSVKVSENDEVGTEDHIEVSLDKTNPSKTIYWTLNDGTNNSETTCASVVKAVDDKSPVFTTAELKETIKYSEQSKTCGANYSQTAEQIKTLLGIEDCSLKEVSYCLREKGKTECLKSDKVYEEGAYKAITTDDLPHGDYEIVYTATDGTNDPATKTQAITIVDDVKPAITCIPDFTMNLDAKCKAEKTITFTDFAKDYLFKAGVIDTTDGTITKKSGYEGKISYGIDGDNITYITDECGEKLDVLYKKGSESEKNLKDESVKV